MTAVPDPHLALVRDVVPHTPQGCEECLRLGTDWVQLRLCLSCGHVGCCDSSPGRRARHHAGTAGHPIIRSTEPGEDWRWCYVDEAYVWTPPSERLRRGRLSPVRGRRPGRPGRVPGRRRPAG